MATCASCNDNFAEVSVKPQDVGPITGGLFGNFLDFTGRCALRGFLTLHWLFLSVVGRFRFREKDTPRVLCNARSSGGVIIGPHDTTARSVLIFVFASGNVYIPVFLHSTLPLVQLVVLLEPIDFHMLSFCGVM